jgi:hypothetical protein
LKKPTKNYMLCVEACFAQGLMNEWSSNYSVVEAAEIQSSRPESACRQCVVPRQDGETPNNSIAIYLQWFSSIKYRKPQEASRLAGVYVTLKWGHTMQAIQLTLDTSLTKWNWRSNGVFPCTSEMRCDDVLGSSTALSLARCTFAISISSNRYTRKAEARSEKVNSELYRSTSLARSLGQFALRLLLGKRSKLWLASRLVEQTAIPAVRFIYSFSATQWGSFARNYQQIKGIIPDVASWQPFKKTTEKKVRQYIAFSLR